jgi:outer membrane protein
MKKGISSVVAVVAFLFCANVAFAASSMNMAVVDAAKILQTSSKVKAASNQLRKKFSSTQEDIKQQQASIEKEIKSLQKNSAVMSAKKKASTRTRIMGERKALMVKVAKFQGDVGKAQRESMQKLSTHLREVIAKIAKSNGADVVLDKQMTLYSAGAKDITNEVERKFDAS